MTTLYISLLLIILILHFCFHSHSLQRILSLAVLCVLVSVTTARSGGAPNGACATIAPSTGPHGNPQDTPSPYSVTIDPFPANGRFTPGATYTITFSACGNSTMPFRGFLISPVNINMERQGRWTILDSTNTQTTCEVSPCVYVTYILLCALL